MRIGFDAKRAFFNFSGLGNYSRNTIRQMGLQYPDIEYYLYIPKHKLQIPNQNLPNQQLIYPDSWAGRRFPSFWRSNWLNKPLMRDGIDLYHGLSNEIPFGIHKHDIRSVVTIHDLIFIRFPQWYNPIDRLIYTRKSRYACKSADRIIAVSSQTKDDIMEYFGIPSERIEVIYQVCDPAFYMQIEEDQKKIFRKKYGLPSQYLLYVGTIEPRKNLLQIVKALHIASLRIPLVIIGRSTGYAELVRQYISDHQMDHIYFLGNLPNDDLPAIYQMAEVFIYPSRFEGFGIPILEALVSGTPVITSKGGCFSEAGGSHSLYVDPDQPEEIAESISKILEDANLHKLMSETGRIHAEKFNAENIASGIMNVYNNIL
jgi:glycosyltransferase involved in cell wall biosynthesis